MHSILTLDEWSRDDLRDLFALADGYQRGQGPRLRGTAALFFPASSLRTRLSFELGAQEAGLRTVLFPPETLDTDENPLDTVLYAAEWIDVLVVRHPRLAVLRELSAPGVLPVVNAMTSENHPCEVLSALYALSGEKPGLDARFIVVGPDGNIARGWAEAARAFDLDLTHCCPRDLATPGVPWTDDLKAAVAQADVIITDSPGHHAEALEPFRITGGLLAGAPPGVRLAPCPPFIRGREVSDDALSGDAFVGHRFLAALRPVQQALLATALGAAQPALRGT